MLNSITSAAKAGGNELLKYFGQVLTVKEKTHASDFCTEADITSEKAILKVLQKDFLSYNYYSEEQGNKEQGSEYTFIIDPLDGTNNFTLGVPHFSVSIALERRGETVLAVVYNPFLKKIYSAERGKGALMDGVKIKTSHVKNLEKATIAYTTSYNNDGTELESLIAQSNKQGIKRLLLNWSPALDYCLLASGKIEAVICNNDDMYDNAAGKLIVKEAGGIIKTWNGNPELTERNTQFIAANNGQLLEEVRSLCVK